MAIPVIVVDPLQDKLEQLELWADGRHLERKLSNFQLPEKSKNILETVKGNIQREASLTTCCCSDLPTWKSFLGCYRTLSRGERRRLL